jgi:YceI-like domain/5TMR of 5TMR-LYT
MSDDYIYDPRALQPWLAGLGAGAVAGIAGTLLAFTLRSPDDIVANSLTVSIGAILIGLVSGLLWRRLRATDNGLRTFRWAMAGGFLVTLVAIAILDQAVLSNLISYAVPVDAVIFATIGLLTPLLASSHWPAWSVVIIVVATVGLAVGLFGKGNVESGELSLSDLTTTTLAPPPISSAGDTPASTSPPDVANSATFSTFTITEGAATWTVPETLQGLASVAVGRSDELTGTITPGEGFEFSVDLTTFTSDQPRRDQFVRRMFAADPIAVFTSDSFEVPDAPDGEVITMQVEGTMIVNATPRDVVWDVEARKDGSVVSVTGELDIVLTDFGITPPSLAFVRVQDEAHLEVLFQAEGA